MRNPGIIYETDKGQFGLAYHKEQHTSFEAIQKVYIHLFVDSICTKPVVDESGKRVAVLKSIDKLKMIGFAD